MKLELLADINMLLMVEKGIRGGISHAIHRYVKANNKCIDSLYLEYLDANNLYRYRMSQKLSVNGFNWKENIDKFDEDFIKQYVVVSKERYVLEVDAENPKNVFNFHSDFPFLAERKKIKKCNKLVCDTHDKEHYVVHIRALKQALNHGLIPKKVHRVIQFNKKEWSKPYIERNTKLSTEAKNDFEKDFFKLMNNAVFGKTIENVRKHRDIKLVTTDGRRNQLASETYYHITKYFSENLLAIEMK